VAVSDVAVSASSGCVLESDAWYVILGGVIQLIRDSVITDSDALAIYIRIWLEHSPDNKTLFAGYATIGVTASLSFAAMLACVYL
jgi:hypothetical protein